MLEAPWQRIVLDWLAFYGWRYYHTQRSDRSVPGFLDLVAVREREIHVELKATGKDLAPDQRAWCLDLWAAGVEVHIWDPECLLMVHRVLGHVPGARLATARLGVPIARRGLLHKAEKGWKLWLRMVR